MDNHVHLIAVPSSVQSLTKSMSETHRKYTIMINTRENWTGHLWQGRFLSYPMDERHLYLAVRYIERNPVRAGVVKIAEHYTWSSAKAHVENTPDFILSEFYLMSQIKNWRSYLKKEETSEEIELFKSHEKTGRPLGSKVFIAQLETITGRKLRKRRGGRPRKKNR
jgi:putative transposase